jgi:hypothetical protein
MLTALWKLRAAYKSSNGVGRQNCMTDYSVKNNAPKENSIMPTPISTRKRRIKGFKEFIRSKERPRTRLKLRESENHTDAIAELQYDVVGLPRDVPHSEKMARISELAETITSIPDSDVFLLSLWMGG